MTPKNAVFVALMCVMCALACVSAHIHLYDDADTLRFLESALSEEDPTTLTAIAPSTLSDRFLTCPVDDTNQPAQGELLGTSYTWKSAGAGDGGVDYSQDNWEAQISANWTAFDHILDQFNLAAPDTDGVLSAVVIDVRRVNGKPAYVYLGTRNRQHEKYEPWSSCKFMAFSAGTAAVRAASSGSVGASAGAKAGLYAIADLATAIPTYRPSGNVPGNSNGIALYFLQLVGTAAATDLLHQSWLKVDPSDTSHFFGQWGAAAFPAQAQGGTWTDGAATQKVQQLSDGTKNDDKYMSAMVQAEWLKRLSQQALDPTNKLPNLQDEDVETLFYGPKSTAATAPAGGMSAGVGRFLVKALLGGKPIPDPKLAASAMDLKYGTKWRVYQKLGSGISTKRKRNEIIIAAYACLPSISREFVVVIRCSNPGSTGAYARVQNALNAMMASLVPQSTATQ